VIRLAVNPALLACWNRIDHRDGRTGANTFSVRTSILGSEIRFPSGVIFVCSAQASLKPNERACQRFDDLSEELRLHIEERVAQLTSEGLSPQEAERQARIAFGNLALVEERSREVWQWSGLV
jgi:hypothetical protein